MKCKTGIYIRTTIVAQNWQALQLFRWIVQEMWMQCGVYNLKYCHRFILTMYILIHELETNHFRELLILTNKLQSLLIG